MASAWLDISPDSEESGWFLIGLSAMLPYAYRSLRSRLRGINAEELKEGPARTQLVANSGVKEEDLYGFRIHYEKDNKISVHENLMALLERDFEQEDIHHTKAAEDLFQDREEEKRKYEERTRNAKRIRDNLDMVPKDLEDADIFFQHISHRLKRQLYSQQAVSAYHLAFAANACNFSVPGAGKTAIVYAAFSFLRDVRRSVNSLMVVGPPSSFFPWESEYTECFGEAARSSRLRGRREVREGLVQGAHQDLYLLSYQSASLAASHIRRFLRASNRQVMLVLDEAHRIKNPEGIWASALLGLAPEAGVRVVLTGTPAPNGYEDIVSLYDFIWPERRLISFSHGYLRNITLAERENQVTPSIREDKEQLIKEISPYFIRIKKSHLGLPVPEESVIHVEMDEDQTTVGRYIELASQHHVGADNPLLKAKAIRLLQCASYLPLLRNSLDEVLSKPWEEPSYDVDNLPENVQEIILGYQQDPPKFRRLLELLRSEVLRHKGADGRAVVWCVFNLTIDSLRSYLEKNDIPAEVIYGKTPTREIGDGEDEEDEDEGLQTREGIIQSMHRETGPKVLIANIKALGESVSLHKACRHAFFLERDYNAGLFMQAKDRIHRVGLEPNDAVRYYYMVSTNSIDEVVHERLREKAEQMYALIENEEIPLLNLDLDSDSDEGLMKILREYLQRD